MQLTRCARQLAEQGGISIENRNTENCIGRRRGWSHILSWISFVAYLIQKPPVQTRHTARGKSRMKKKYYHERLQGARDHLGPYFLTVPTCCEHSNRRGVFIIIIVIINKASIFHVVFATKKTLLETNSYIDIVARSVVYLHVFENIIIAGAELLRMENHFGSKPNIRRNLWRRKFVFTCVHTHTNITCATVFNVGVAKRLLRYVRTRKKALRQMPST